MTSFDSILAVTLTLLLSLTLGSLGAEVKVTVREDLAPGSVVSRIPNDTNLREVVSSSDLASLRYRFLNQDAPNNQLFVVGESSGDLSLAPGASLDRETLCPFARDCSLLLEMAIQSLLTQFFRTVKVEVEILDVNDNAPTFSVNATTLSVSEAVVVGASFPIEGAIDRDTGANNSLQTYDLQPSDGPFSLSFTKNRDGTSFLNLVVRDKLDHEVTQSYQMTVIARDGGSPPLTGRLALNVTVLDVNDNAPEFTQASYNVTVEETVAPGTSILALTARDRDSGENGQVVYRLSPHQAGKIAQLFHVNLQTGVLSVAGNLQNETEETYEIIVEASDRGLQPFTQQTAVLVTVLDTANNPPRIRLNLLTSPQQQATRVSELAKAGTMVSHVAVTDPDRGKNGIVTCRLLPHAYFELQGFDVNEYKIIVARPLDRELIPQHNVSLHCQDAGSPPLTATATLTVQVGDENDNAPRFTQLTYSVSVEENNAPGTSLLRVTAHDPDEGLNAAITYSLASPTSAFLVDEQTGVITATQAFDYEEASSINFTVLASDQGTPERKTATARVVVTIQDINDQPPTFAQPVFDINVSESSAAGKRIGQVTAFDLEKGQNGRIRILPSPDTPDLGPFQLAENGSIFLTKKLNFEVKSRYEFRVLAVDLGEPPLNSTAVVVVNVRDENEHQPVVTFPNATHNKVVVTTETSPDFVVAAVAAHDEDSGPNKALKFVITSRNDSGRFDVRPESGEVFLVRKLGSSDVNLYKLVVMVQDSGSPPLAASADLFIRVALGNDSGDAARQAQNQQNILIAVSIVCATVVIAAIIVLIMVVMRRMDSGRSKPPVCILQPQSKPTVLANYVDKVKVDLMSEGEKREQTKESDDTEFGFPISGGQETGNAGGPPLYSARLGQQWAGPRAQEDVQSDTSGETTTSDSGRGGSEEDICSTNGVTSSHVMEDLQDRGRDSGVHDSSFQSGMSSVPPAPPPRVAAKPDPRTSNRKHVTFSDPRGSNRSAGRHSLDRSVYPTPTPNLMHSHWKNPNPAPSPTQETGFGGCGPERSASPYRHPGLIDKGRPQSPYRTDRATPIFTPLQTVLEDHRSPPPVLPPRAAAVPPRENFERLCQVRDWRNDSVATEDADDRSTTTSGSYTLTQEDTLPIEFPDWRDVVV